MEFKTTLGKGEVAKMLNVCPATLGNWLNNKYYTELKLLGYQKWQHILTPKQLNFLQSKIDIQPNN